MEQASHDSAPKIEYLFVKPSIRACQKENFTTNILTPSLNSGLNPATAHWYNCQSSRDNDTMRFTLQRAVGYCAYKNS